MPYYRAYGGDHDGVWFESDHGCPPEVRFRKRTEPTGPMAFDSAVDMTTTFDTYRRLDVARGKWRQETILVPLNMPDADALALWDKRN